MPEITRFDGMVIKMYLRGREHNPPHIHVLYKDYNGVIDLNTMMLDEGDLPSNRLERVIAWASLHQDELLEMWNSQKFKKLPPLN
jgi:hypothetical protein